MLHILTSRRDLTQPIPNIIDTVSVIVSMCEKQVLVMKID
jgi:hypothetical protein